MSNRPLVTVGGLVVAPDGDILLVRSKKWNDLYTLPGGKVEEGETREEACKREIWEETGLKVTHLRFAIVQDSIFSTEFWEKRHFVMHDFIAHLDHSCVKEDVKLNDEAYTYCWIAPQRAFTLPLHIECRLLIEWYLKDLQSSYAIVGITQHRISCIIGIYPEERQSEQTLLIDLKVKLDVWQCLRSGLMEDTVDYVMLAELCTQLAQKKYRLLETFASEILDQCMQQFPILWGWVRISKPSAIPTAACAYVELEQNQKDEKRCGH